MDIQDKKVFVARLSIISNTTLIALKIVVGLMTGSISIISEAAHSGADLIAAFIAFSAVRKSSKPADEKHPFGHGKIENVSGTIEAFLILVAAIWIIYEAIKRLINPQPLEAVGWGVGIMLISSIVNWIVSKKLFKVGKETDSVALLADAWHLKTDIFTAMGVMFGLLLIWIGEWMFPGNHFHWIDPIAAITVAILIFHAAYQLTMHSAKDLLDVTLPAEEQEYISHLIGTMYPDVYGFHKMRTRKAGSFRFVEFHMQVDPYMTVEASHRITDVITEQINERLPNSSVTIHVEPCEFSCSEECKANCLLSYEERELLKKKMKNQS
jgi:cation diffusion facilitator family transporter